MRPNLRQIAFRFPENDTAKLVAVVAATFLLGVGVAGAAISTAPRDTLNPALQPLTTTAGLELRRALGPDDEDCFVETRRVKDEAGHWTKKQRVVCPDE